LSRSPHDEFLELCAGSTAGQLSEEEEKRLSEHLAVCCSCREVMKQYEAVAGEAVLAFKHSQTAESSPEWSEEQAEATLFERLKVEDEFCGVGRAADGSPAEKPFDSLPLSATQASWRNVGILCATGLLLLVALGISAYQVGTRHGTHVVSVSPPRQPFDQSDLQRQLSDAGHEREVLRSQIAKRDQEIAALRQELDQQVTEVSRLKLTEHQLATDLEMGQASRQDLSQQRTELTQKLEKAEAKNQDLQDRLGLLERQSTQDKQRAGSLEAQGVGGGDHWRQFVIGEHILEHHESEFIELLDLLGRETAQRAAVLGPLESLVPRMELDIGRWRHPREAMARRAPRRSRKMEQMSRSARHLLQISGIVRTGGGPRARATRRGGSGAGGGPSWPGRARCRPDESSARRRASPRPCSPPCRCWPGTPRRRVRPSRTH